jgi:ABC-type glutathione transport system ATPase component
MRRGEACNDDDGRPRVRLLEPGVSTAAPLLQVQDLRKSYADQRGGQVDAVRGVSFDLAPGEVLGIVGESGCGKTTLGRTIMRLMDPTAGRILLEGEDFGAMEGRTLKAARRKMQMVFQDPFGSLNPRHKVIDIIAEPLVIHGEAGARERARELLAMVGLPAEAGARYPHEFSGGQRQRIAIARALALKPKLVIADEPVSALDVSIQSQIINLISDLKAEFGLSMIFISHDLSVIRHVSDRVAVMRHGEFVETGPVADVLERPRHAYAQALVAAIPKLRRRQD